MYSKEIEHCVSEDPRMLSGSPLLIKALPEYTAKPFAFDSYMVGEADLSSGGLRLLEVDNRVVLPFATHVRVLITSADVLHSWAVPSLGVKADACPGRLNQASVYITREGVYYGQCSEICGVNHGFMPVVVQSYASERGYRAEFIPALGVFQPPVSPYGQQLVEYAKRFSG